MEGPSTPFSPKTQSVSDAGTIGFHRYKPGETYESVFGKLASTMEECRAETAATYLTLFPQVLTIWGINETEAERFGYLMWLQEASAGITSLAQYKPDTDSWGEAHAQGHVAILRVMQESGVATIEIITGADGEPDILVTLDRARIPTDGKKAMGTFLLGLEVKSIDLLFFT